MNDHCGGYAAQAHDLNRKPVSGVEGPFEGSRMNEVVED